MKIYYTLPILSFLLMGASCNPSVPDSPCGEVPIYKPFSIDIPARPKLESDELNNPTDGLIVRTAERDMSLLLEYSKKLENLLLSLPKNLSSKE